MIQAHEQPDAFSRLRALVQAIGGSVRKRELYEQLGVALEPYFPAADYSVLLHDTVTGTFFLDYSTSYSGVTPVLVDDIGPLARTFTDGLPFRTEVLDAETLHDLSVGEPVISIAGGHLPVVTADILSHRAQPFGLLVLHRHSAADRPQIDLGHSWLPLITEVAGARLALLELYGETEIAAETRKTKLDVLHEVAQFLTQLDLDVLLTKILELSLHIVNAEVGSLMLWERDQLVSKVEWGLTDSVVLAIRAADGTPLVRIVSRENQVRFVPRLREEPGLDLTELTAGVTSFLCLPLTAKDRTLGVINIVNAETAREITPQDLEVLQTMTDLAAIAVENAILYKSSIERERMAEQLKIASEIQKSLLPDAPPLVSGLRIGSLSLPCDETGGDYFDFFDEFGNSLGVAIGDVSGHGIASALLMATARAFLRSMIGTVKDLSALFRLLNNVLERDMEEDRFMTLFLGVIDPRKGSMTYVSAGHDSPLVYRAAEDRFEELESTGPPLGMFADMEYETVTVDGFNAGDLILFSTDGVWEAMDASRESFGHERLAEEVRKHRNLPPQEIVKAVEAAVREFCAGAPQHDDITLVVTRIETMSA